MEPMSEAQRAIFEALPEVQELVQNERRWRANVEPSRQAEVSRRNLGAERKKVERDADAFRRAHPFRTWLHEKGLVRATPLTLEGKVERAFFETVVKNGYSWATAKICEDNANFFRTQLKQQEQRFRGSLAPGA